MKRKHLLALSLVLSLLLCMGAGCGGGGTTPEESGAASLAQQAREEMDAGGFTRATQLYQQAREAYLSEGDAAAARECLDRIQDMSAITMTYPYGEDELRGLLAEAFAQVPEDERESWLESGELEHLVIDGEPRYFLNIIDNIRYRDVDLFRQDEQMLAGYEGLYRLMVKIMDEPRGPAWQPYGNPVSYRGTHVLSVPRDELPASGLLKMWFPIPIVTGPQPTVRVVSITPDTYVAQAPSIDEDIGLAYMEIPLDELEDDLEMSLTFEFDHYEQRFEVDPEKVSAYDTDSALYREYTASAGNIQITPEIAETARGIVGDETNTYLAAKKIYDYVVDNITYSLVPHTALWPRGEYESVYVHEHGFGDCGAQSMYFSALCRAVGIPARTTGGWQLFSGNLSGHFWAEFYLPGYGWVPVDPTAAESADYIPGLSEAEVRSFKDFFFANQDHFRCVVQHDVDEQFTPPALHPITYTVALQSPASNCDTMEEMPDLVINEHWTTRVEVLNE